MTLLDDTALRTLGRKIRTARQMAEMKQDDLARICGVSRSAIGQWESDETEPSATKLFAIARATQQPLGWFAEGLLHSARSKGLEPPTFWSVVSLGSKGCPCRDYHGRGDCPFGCACGWCAPELYDPREDPYTDAAFWATVAQCQGAPDTVSPSVTGAGR